MKKGQRIGFNTNIGASGHKFIYFDKVSSAYVLRISANPPLDDHYIGRYQTLEDALEARDKFFSDYE